MFVPDLATLGRILLLTPLAYAGVVLALRLSGKRSLAKLNAFDLIVTVALGSILASTITSSSTTLAAGLLAFALLLVLQVAVSWVTSRRGTRSSLIRAEPLMILHEGRLLPEALRRARLTEDEVRQAVRSQGIGGFDQVAAVCLETDGTLSVVPTSQRGDGAALADVQRLDAESGVAREDRPTG
ncbi:DUF421 domain-containing protein [Brachybacterium sp. EF45031]|uniref:DUF421 domain-containing protein n=1 Tax=Brachybacterium sillae TaxID=2810536 RepID=UPI00217E3090|nr:YetF domain-containing protein [Brachybacterium sillae]MCS6712003.1 DUF421 domain-containing protein [Brachybacterium sillae]